jgi:hypothetical protein
LGTHGGQGREARARAAYRIRSGVEGVIRSSIVHVQDSGDLGEPSIFGGVSREYRPTRWFLDQAGHVCKAHFREIPGERNATGSVVED